MAKMMQFVYFCDNGKDAGHPKMTVEGDTVLVWSPKQAQVVELDLCDECLEGLNLHGITALADALGREIPEPEIDTALICPFGCNDSKPFKSMGGRNLHMTRRHPDHGDHAA